MAHSVENSIASLWDDQVRRDQMSLLRQTQEMVIEENSVLDADERIKQLTKEADALAERASEILALIKAGQGTDADWQELDRIEADMTSVRVALMHALEIKAH